MKTRSASATALVRLLAAVLATHAVTASAATLHVWQNSPGSVPPYATWASAATNIQDAIDAASDGDEIVVTNGVYATGGRGVLNTAPGFNYVETNRVAVTKAVTVRSVNGPAATVIEGYTDHSGWFFANAIRCVYLAEGAKFIGFTLTNGSAGSDGGGVWCHSTNALIADCILTGNLADGEGGGAYRATIRDSIITRNIVGDEGGGVAYSVLTNCVVLNNSASDAGGAYLSALVGCLVLSNSAFSSGGGALDSTLVSCVVSNNFAGAGGGASQCLMENSVLANNRAAGDAGGAHGGVLHNCILQNNFAGDDGGGAADSTLVDCVLTGNSADAGGGADGGTLDNCTLASNSAKAGGGAAYATLNDCRLVANSAVDDGGGAFLSVLVRCQLEGNEAGEGGGGAYLCGLANCTITGNASREGGGGVHGSTLHDCTLSENSTVENGGGGASNSRLNNCLLVRNSAGTGGGAAACILNNCTVTGNSAGHSGGVAGCTLTNCIVYYNSATNRPNCSVGFMTFITFTCTTPLPEGIGNITNAPLFVNAAAGNYRLKSGSPCIDAGTDLGAFITSDLAGYPRPRDGNGDGVAAFDMGAFERRLGFVSAHSPNPSWPFATWETAAHELYQVSGDADEFDSVLVTNGVYAPASVDADVHLQSVNGPGVTVIDGAGAGRCLMMDGGAVLSGFTVRNGYAFDGFPGGGAWCHPDAILTNCIIEWNNAGMDGGGVFGGKLYRCVIRNNESWASNGGGASHAELHECLVTGNACYDNGGGVSESTLYNCIITKNHADFKGGGANLSTLYHCTLASNGDGNDGDNGCCSNGAINSDFYNCIVSDRVAASDAWFSWVPSLSIPAVCCGNINNPPPMFVDAASGDYRLRPGSPCIDAGTNLSATLSHDFDGRPRPMDGNSDGVAAFDMGAFESGHRTFIPRVLGSFTNADFVLDVAVSAGRAYLAANTEGLLVIDVTDPASPRLLGSYDISWYATRVAISGHYAYVADGSAGLHVIDIQNPVAPVRVGGFAGDVTGVTVAGDYAYVLDTPPAAGFGTLHVLSVSNPASPQRLGGLSGILQPTHVEVAGNVAYVANKDGVQKLEVSNPANLVPLGYYEDDDDEHFFPHDVKVHGNPSRIYLAGDEAGLLTFRPQDLDVPDLDNPLDSEETGGARATGVALSGHVAYVAAGATLEVFPGFEGELNESIAHVSIPGGDARRVTVAGHLIFVAAGKGGLQILLTAIPARLQVVGLFEREFHFTADAPPGSSLQFEYSRDLLHWSDRGSTYIDATSQDFYKDDFNDEAQLFFRAFWR